MLRPSWIAIAALADLGALCSLPSSYAQEVVGKPSFDKSLSARPLDLLAPPEPAHACAPGNPQLPTAISLSPQARFTGCRPRFYDPGVPLQNAPLTAPAKSAPQPAENWVIPSILENSEARPVTLVECVHTSIASRRIFNSLSGDIIVEKLTAFEPQIIDQQIGTELSRFDPTLTSLVTGSYIDRPPNSFFGPGLEQNSRLNQGEFVTRLSKIWPTGLTTSLGYEPSLAYLFFPLGNSSGFNPTHSSDLVVRFNQPLLRGGNRESNLATLRVAEQRSMQSRSQVEAVIQAQLRSVEQVYWKLHADHVRLKAVDEALLLARKTQELVRLRYEAERTIYSDVARATVKLENLLQQRLEAELLIRKSSFNLSQLVGFEVGDASVLVPIDTPERQAPQFDSDAIVASAIAGNLELKARRQEIDIRRQFARSTANQRLPQLDLQALHRTSGLDDSLGSSLRQMAGFEFNDYALGLLYTQQLGYRQADSKLRTAQLEAAREAALLTAVERQVGFDVLSLLNQLKQSYRSYESSVRQLSQAQKWAELAQLRYEDPPLQNSGQESLLVLLLDYQAALQAKVDAIVQVASSLAEFNGLLATIEERRGHILARWGVVVTP